MPITDLLCRSFLDLWAHFDPAAETTGRLGAFDPDSIRQHVVALRSIAAAVEDLDVEDTADEIDRTALLDHLRVLLFRFEHEHPYQRNPSLWVEHLALAFESVLSRGGDDDAAAGAALERIRGIPRFTDAARQSLRKPPRILVAAAVEQLAAVGGLLQEVGLRFGAAWSRNADDAAAVMEEAQRALETLGDGLRGGIPSDSDPHGAAIGEAEVDRRLHYEHASIHNAAEVWRGALRLAAEVEQEVTALAAAIDPGRPWREVYEKIKHCGRPAGDPVGAMREAIERAREFALAHGVEGEGVTTGSGRVLEVEPLPATVRVLEPVAVYRARAERSAALLIGDMVPAQMPWLAARLAEPGLHLHHLRSERLPGLVRREISAISTPLGWALYAQELMAELEYQPEPESRLVERVLFLREVHLAVVDIGLHTRQLTTEEAMAHLTERIPSDRRTALADVRRLASGPLSACAAILGWQELGRLRDDYRAARGADFSLAGFHEEVFSYGGLPVPLIRWGMGLDA